MQDEMTDQSVAVAQREEESTTKPVPQPDSHAPVESEAQPGRGDGEQWQDRAQRAERSLAELADRLTESEASLEQARHAIDAVEQRRRIERTLEEAHALDLETATILTAAAIEGMDEPDVAIAVRDLQRRKPFLFRTRPNQASVMSAADAPREDSVLGEVAETARRTGDRRELLRYLRMKRGG